MMLWREFHVLEDLGHRERRRSGQPRRWEQRHQQGGAPTTLKAALDAQDLADVSRVAFAAVGQDLVADRVQLAADVIEVVGCEVLEKCGAHGISSWGS